MPVAGLEPARIAPHDFESCASANSATPAWQISCASYILPHTFFVCNKNFFDTQNLIGYYNNVCLIILTTGADYEKNCFS